jgi:hypothetical protein
VSFSTKPLLTASVMTPLAFEQRRQTRDTHADWAALIQMQKEQEEEKGVDIPEMVESARIIT